MTVTVHHGDSRDVLRSVPDSSIDSAVTDPPYALVSIGKRFGADGAAPAQVGKSGAYARASAGFMGQKWDTGEVAFDPEFWRDVLRVLKPGAHLLAFGGTRTYHRLAVAIEDAGFEIRDAIQWLYGSGFPKSHNVGKAIDKAAGATREVIAEGEPVKRMIPGADQNRDGWEKNDGRVYVPTETAPATDGARQWDGWGTALKPAAEIICVARKPLGGTVAANVLEHGCGALNIGACRVEGNRWPANVAHDGGAEILEGFPMQVSGGTTPSRPRDKTRNTYGAFGGQENPDGIGSTAGSAARFFYSAKADAADRLGSKHPTVKPVDLMRWLVRLVTPPGGVVLDPFAGSGTTGMACLAEGFDAVLIEREAAFVEDIKRRVAHVSGHDAPLFTHATDRG